VVWLDVIIRFHNIVFDIINIIRYLEMLNLFELTKTGFDFLLSDVPVKLVEERLRFDLFMTNLKSGSLGTSSVKTSFEVFDKVETYCVRFKLLLDRIGFIVFV